MYVLGQLQAGCRFKLDCRGWIVYPSVGCIDIMIFFVFVCVVVCAYLIIKRRLAACNFHLWGLVGRVVNFSVWGCYKSMPCRQDVTGLSLRNHQMYLILMLMLVAEIHVFMTFTRWCEITTVEIAISQFCFRPNELGWKLLKTIKDRTFKGNWRIIWNISNLKSPEQLIGQSHRATGASVRQRTTATYSGT